MTNYIISLETASENIIQLLETFQGLDLLTIRTIMDEESGEID